MQYTTHFNLNVPEGTDIVNPLVQDNPNWTDIDDAMFANKQSVIGTASEVVSGTVHAITRSNADSDYFKFTATGNWNAGDSMSVDGTNVSVYLSDGTTPDTGAYIINTEVLALLAGSRVTLLVSSGVSSDIGNLASLTTTDKSDLVSAINEVNASIPGNRGSVSVTADGIKSFGELFDDLYGTINLTKIKEDSKLIIETLILNISGIDPSYIDFGCSMVTRTYVARLMSTGSLYRQLKLSDASFTDATTAVPVSGTVIQVIY